LGGHGPFGLPLATPMVCLHLTLEMVDKFLSQTKYLSDVVYAYNISYFWKAKFEFYLKKQPLQSFGAEIFVENIKFVMEVRRRYATRGRNREIDTPKFSKTNTRTNDIILTLPPENISYLLPMVPWLGVLLYVSSSRQFDSKQLLQQRANVGCIKAYRIAFLH